MNSLNTDISATSDITFPIEVNHIKLSKNPVLLNRTMFGQSCGKFVAVRPCAKEFGDKTFLGVLIGAIAVEELVSFDKDSHTLSVERCLYNPLIFIPDRSKTVFGYESWWGEVRDETHLKEITDEDIKNVWYVKALAQLAERDKS